MKNIQGKSKICIKVELECKTEELEARLIKLHDCINSAKDQTNQLYNNTEEHLKLLLENAITKIREKDGANVGTIQNDSNTLCGFWEGIITLSTVSKPPPHV